MKKQFAFILAISTFMLTLILPSHSTANIQPLNGHWNEIAPNFSLSSKDYPRQIDKLTNIQKIDLLGGTFLYDADFNIASSGRYVIDFSTTTIIGRFTHHIYNASGQKIAELQGGIQAPTENDFFLRLGREIYLEAGNYQLITEMSSPYYVGHPEPYLDTIQHYRKSIRLSNAITLIGLGIFIGLGFYYAAMSIAKRRKTEAMYALFILGNLIYFSGAHNLLSQMFGITNMFVMTAVILFSNIAYILFAMGLLNVKRMNSPILFYLGYSLVALLSIFIIVAFVQTNWVMELARAGVGIFLLYGLVLATYFSIKGLRVARLYFVAIAAFFLLGGITITLENLEGGGIYTFHIEHTGIFSVAIEVILLAIVMSYDFKQVYAKKDLMTSLFNSTREKAYTDSLTGVGNRYAYNDALANLNISSSLTIVDMDNLKSYNDEFGHAKGDEYIAAFAEQISKTLPQNHHIYRIGGDEFAIIAFEDIDLVSETITTAINTIKENGYERAHASFGTSYMIDHKGDTTELQHEADRKLYKHKMLYKSGFDSKTA